MGYLPVDEIIGDKQVYDRAYFDKYVFYSQTDMGRALTAARVALVNKYCKGHVIDIGIGCGQFVEERNKTGFKTTGTDINPIAIEWLKERNLWGINDWPTSLTFWDSLEHFKDPSYLINGTDNFIFVTIPIFENYNHIARSKHFRPDEHYLYFNHHGFVSYMWNLGFRMVEFNNMEETLGREDVTTYVFKRR